MKFKAPIEVKSSLVDSSNSSGSAGQVLTSTGVGVDWIEPTLLPAESAEKVIQTVRFGEAISKGDPLVITGYHGSTGPAIVERADATDATKMPAYGVALEDYASNATGLMIAVGDFDDFDTSGYSVGDTLYVAVGGGMTNVKPTGTALIQNMGIVSRSNANNGQVEIVAIGRTNDVPNLPEGRIWVGDGNTIVSDTIYIDEPNNNVGIGTTSPDSLLHVSADVTGANTGTITIEGRPTGFLGDDIATIDFHNNGSKRADIRMERGNAADDSQLVFSTSDTGTLNDALIINEIGNVGIGTTNPSFGTGGGLQITNATQANLRFTDTSASTFITDLALSNDDFYIINRAASGQLKFRVNASNEAMTIDSNGNVGIGTTNPATWKLSVDSSNIYAASFDTSNNVGVVINGNNTTASQIIGFSNSNSTYNELHLRTNSTSTDGLYIDASGNVGIGTTSPSEKLDVVGNIELNGVLYIGSRGIYQQENTDVSGLELVANASTSLYRAAFFDYVIQKAGNVRAGTVFACNDGGSVEYTETSTNDIGDTSDVVLSVDISGGNMRLLADAATSGWSVKSLIRAI